MWINACFQRRNSLGIIPGEYQCLCVVMKLHPLEKFIKNNASMFLVMSFRKGVFFPVYLSKYFKIGKQGIFVENYSTFIICKNYCHIVNKIMFGFFPEMKKMTVFCCVFWYMLPPLQKIPLNL
jgi:hypothetical protein